MQNPWLQPLEVPETGPRGDRLRGDRGRAHRDALWSDIGCFLAAPATPLRVFLPSVSRLHLSRMEAELRRTNRGPLRVEAAYSVKTNPDPKVLAVAHDHGLFAEAISQLEVEHAVRAGFAPRDIVLNGPAKWWPPRPRHATLRAVFCDSASELRQTVETGPAGGDLADVVGVRVRPAGVSSRFGAALSEPDVFDDVAGSFARLDATTEVGLHLHLSPYLYGVERWWRMVAELVGHARALERTTGRVISCLDLGGGWRPADFVGAFLPAVPTTLAPSRTGLAGLRRVLLEPGRAVAEPLVALVTTVLDVRRRAGCCEVVVDGSIAEVPEIGVHRHQWLWCSAGGPPTPLRPGQSSILGRSCMETDVMATNVEIPQGLRAGDVLVVTDVGAYDTSKSYTFGRGDDPRPTTSSRA